MRNLLLTALLFCAVRSFGATGATNCVGLEVETNGWVLRVTLGGNAVGTFGTNCQFYNGFGTNNTPSATNRLTLTVTSPGFSDLGVSQAVARVVYGTHLLRLPYPSNTTNDFTAQDSAGTNVVGRIALSERIFNADTLTATARAGYIVNTNGSVDAAAFSGAAVTNSSTQPYLPVCGNWSWPGYELMTNSTYQPRAVAFHINGQQRRPIRVMMFVATGTNGTPSTNYQTQPVVDRSIGDAVSVPEYVGNVDISGISNGAPVRMDFVAYPWLGVAPLSTFSNTWFYPNGNPAAYTNICNRLGTYGAAFAVVSTTNNSGSAGVVSKTFNSAAPPLAFDTIAHAYSAMVSSNNASDWYSRNDAGGGIIYLREGNHDWTGAGTPSGNVPDAWVTYQSFPGASMANVKIAGSSGNNICKGREKVVGVYITNTAAILFYSETKSHMLWLDQCEMNVSGANAVEVFVSATTRSAVDRIGQGFRGGAGDNVSPTLIRGNTISNYGAFGIFWTFIGNNRLPPNSAISFIGESLSSSTPLAPKYPIFAFNKVMGNYDGPVMVLDGRSNFLACAVVQNVLEQATNTSYLGGWIETTPSYNNTNFIVWQNTVIGQRANFAYNADSTNWRTGFSFRGNLMDALAIKSDTFAPQSGGRIQNWEIFQGVGMIGNYLPAISNVATISFPFDSVSLGSYCATAYNPKGTIRYTASAAYDGVAAGAGNGNYRLLSDSPAFLNGLASDPPLSHDLDGNPRSAIDPPGAYSAGNVRKGAFF